MDDGAGNQSLEIAVMAFCKRVGVGLGKGGGGVMVR